MLFVKFITAQIGDWQSYHDAVRAFENVEWQPIANANWADQFPYTPQVRFQIAYSTEVLLLHYDVAEEFVRANAIRHNDPVYEDSCVECFVSFDGGKSYFNIEFNLLGTGLIGKRNCDGSDKVRMEIDNVNRVSTFTQVRHIAGRRDWQMILAIPFDVLGQDGSALLRTSAQANFYKCGDHLPKPHYMSWKPIRSANPNFHAVSFFGEITFL